MKEHCYWPLVSDLNNVLSHRSVALKFMGDDSLLEMWFVFLSMFQGEFMYTHNIHLKLSVCLCVIGNILLRNILRNECQSKRNDSAH